MSLAQWYAASFHSPKTRAHASVRTCVADADSDISLRAFVNASATAISAFVSAFSSSMTLFSPQRRQSRNVDRSD